MKVFKAHGKLISVLNLLLILLTLVAMTACDKRSLDPNSIQLIEIMMDKNEIYQDNGNSSAFVKVLVKDDNGFPVLGQSINFKADNNRIRILPAQAITDSSGIAEAEVFVLGEILAPNENETTVHISGYLGTKKSLTTTLTVKRNPTITHLELLGQVNVNAAINTEVSVEVRPLSTNNTVLPNGTIVKFETDGGDFVSTDGQYSKLLNVSVVNGVASVKLQVGTEAKTIAVKASIDTLAVYKYVTVKPGIPKEIQLYATATEESNTPIDTVPVNSPAIKVKGVLTDEWYNPIKNKIIALTTNLGTIVQQTTTADSGKFSVDFTPGTVTGTATITAECDSAKTLIHLNLSSSNVQSLQFTNSGPVVIGVQGAGGNESTTLGVKLYDYIGNVITTQGKKILFTLVSAPNGTSVNGENQLSQVETGPNGTAFAFVSSGTESGPVVLKATLLNDDGSVTSPEISVTQSRIIVASGAPHRVDFNIGGYNSSDGLTNGNLNEGSWRVVVSASIKDMWGNPVQKNTAVYFSLSDSTTSAFGQGVSIIPNSYVGNVSAEGDSADGYAFTVLTYHGTLSNETIKVKVKIGQDQTQFEGYLKLPMQNITVMLYPQYQTVVWQGTDATEKYARLYTVVRDGQNNLIRKAKLHFLADRGQFVDTGAYTDIPADNDNLAYTGITDVEGQNIKHIKFQRYECPPAQDATTPGEYQPSINVRVVDTDVTQDINPPIILLRYHPNAGK